MKSIYSENGIYSSTSSATTDVLFSRRFSSDRFHVRLKIGSVACLSGKDPAIVSMIARAVPTLHLSVWSTGRLPHAAHARLGIAKATVDDLQGMSARVQLAQRDGTFPALADAR